MKISFNDIKMPRTMYIATSYIGVGSIATAYPSKFFKPTCSQIHDIVIMYITSVKKVAIACHVHYMHAFMYLITTILLATCDISFFP